MQHLRFLSTLKIHCVDVHQPDFRLQLVVVGYTVGDWKFSHYSFNPFCYLLITWQVLFDVQSRCKQGCERRPVADAVVLCNWFFLASRQSWRHAALISRIAGRFGSPTVMCSRHLKHTSTCAQTQTAHQRDSVTSPMGGCLAQECNYCGTRSTTYTEKHSWCNKVSQRTLL